MTPGQTIGPFFGMALPYEAGEQVVAADHPGAVELTGRVLDGAGEPVPDALLELWQQEGFGRAATDADGRYRFTTVAPTPFAVLAVFARGLPHRLFTRVYPAGQLDRTGVVRRDNLLARLVRQRHADERTDRLTRRHPCSTGVRPSTMSKR